MHTLNGVIAFQQEGTWTEFGMFKGPSAAGSAPPGQAVGTEWGAYSAEQAEAVDAEWSKFDLDQITFPL